MSNVQRPTRCTFTRYSRQVFAESPRLTAVSGAVGLLFGVGIGVGMGALPLPDFVPYPVVSMIAVIASVLTLSLITVAAGTYPARRAAELPPVESLRYE